MPIYEYQCGKCGFEFEREQRITEDPIRSCPKCRSQKARRLISATSFVLKGGGWYSDLYSTPKTPKPDGAASGESAGKDAGASSEGSKDAGAKPAGAAPGGNGSPPAAKPKKGKTKASAAA